MEKYFTKSTPNGQPLDFYAVRSGLNNTTVVIFVGTLKPWHGVADLITAASLARQQWSLRIIGDGPEMETLRAQAERLGGEGGLPGGGLS